MKRPLEKLHKVVKENSRTKVISGFIVYSMRAPIGFSTLSKLLSSRNINFDLSGVELERLCRAERLWREEMGND